MQKVYKNLTPDEAKILDVKYSGPRIKDIPAQDVSLHAKGLLARIHIITGWRLPESEILLSALNHEFSMQIQSRYRDLTIEEIAFAMREYGITTKDWGKSANLSLIDEPIQEYLSARSEVSKVEEQHRPKEIEQAPPEPVDWSDMWQKLKSGEISGKWLDLVPYAAIYDWLEKTGHIVPKNRDKWRWMVRACSQEVNRLAILRDTFQATPDDKEMLELLKNYKWEQGRFPTEQKILSHLIAPAKTVAVIEKLNENG